MCIPAIVITSCWLLLSVSLYTECCTSIVYLVSPHTHIYIYVYTYIYTYIYIYHIIIYIYIYIYTWFPITFRKKSHRWHPSDSEVHRPWRFVALGHQADDPRTTGKEPIWVEATPWAFGVAAAWIWVGDFLGCSHGYGSIPINTIFRGMNIHLPAILMWTTGVRGFDPSPHRCT